MYNGDGLRTQKKIQKGTNSFETHTYYWSDGKLLAETIQLDNSTPIRLKFHYSHAGLTGFTYSKEPLIGEPTIKNYTYIKNSLGDIVGIYSSMGVMCTYTYDAWGNNCTITDHAFEIGIGYISALNPFRYRGYYFDTDLGLYYLQTRYYDPTIGRFISADNAAFLNPSSLNGLNLYSYCGNNPIMRIDFNGNAWWNPFSWNWKKIGRAIAGAALAIGGAVLSIAGVVTSILGYRGSGAIFQAGISTMVYGGCLIASTFDSQIESDMEAISWNPFNNDANAVLNDPNSKVSFYRGVPVIRQNTLNTCSFGIIFVQGGINATDLNHEWGHNVQLMLLGPVKYGLGIAIPSVINYHLNPTNYYSYPWERSADWFGGVTRVNHIKNSEYWGLVYLLLLLAL